MTKDTHTNIVKDITMITDKECKRCGHKWIPRTHDDPIVCPVCKSPYWNRDRKDRR